MLSIFPYVSGPSVCLPWRSVCSSLLPIFYGVFFCLPGVELCEFFIYFGDQTLVCGIIGKCVFSYTWFSFHLNAVFFSHAEAFYFDEVPFVYSFLYVPCFGGRVCEDVAVWNIWDFSCQCFPLGLLWCYDLYLSFLSTLNLFSVWCKLVI